MPALVDRAGLGPDRLALLEGALPELRTLGDVVGWMGGLGLGARISDVVAMDEYTHDVVVPWREGLVLVFDTT